MIREENARLVVRCNCCPARLDLGPAHAVRARNRSPSGWIKTAADTHYCPLCSPNISVASLFAAAAGPRPQSLFG